MPIDPSSSSTFVDNISTEPLPELEDKKLTSHIDELRNLLNQFNLTSEEDPIKVIDSDKQLRIILSELILEIRQQQNDLQILKDNLYVLSNNTEELSNGNKPIKYKQIIYSSEIFGKIHTELEDMYKMSEHVIFLSDNIEKKLLLGRRLYESIVKKIYDYV